MSLKYISLSEQRFLLDTNIYGLLAEKTQVRQKLEENLEKKKIVIYGANVIRRELRKVPKDSRLEGKKLRLVLLQLYDKVIKKELITTDLAISLAKKYFNEYRKLGGINSYNKLKNDFLIVALSSLYALDIIVTEDNKTMASKRANQSYLIVNTKNKLRTPKFIGFKDFYLIL